MLLTGVYVPLITPFDAAGAVAFDALRALANRILDDGAAGLVALGTTAEPAALTAEEQRGVLDVIARVCRERSAHLLVGAGTVEQVTALRTRPAVTAALSLVPPFMRPGEAGVVAHFAALAAASPVPLVVYHVPQRTGQPLSAGTLRALAGIAGVVGVKYATGCVDADAIALLAETEPPTGETGDRGADGNSGNGGDGSLNRGAEPPAGFAILGGDDTFLSPLLALGAQGGITASAHLATGAYVRLVDSWRSGDTARARPLGHRLAALSSALFAAPNPTVIKAVLHAQGRIPTPAVRLPLLPANSDIVRAALRACPAPGEPVS